MTTPKQWNLDLVNAEEAYAMLPRGPSTDRVYWRDIVVGHIDTGVRRHHAFRAADSGATNTLRLEDGLNLMEKGELPLDPMDYELRQGEEVTIRPGHGTKTASVICGHHPGEFKGVAPEVPVIPYRAVNGVDIAKHRIGPVADALRHAASHNGCSVVSISLGNFGIMEEVHDALKTAYRHGVIVVAAAGQVIDRVVYPAKYSRSIAVGGVKANRKVWFRYYYDPTIDYDHARYIDVWAPADDQLVATSWENADSATGDFSHGYETSNGTSYATAHVAAAAAMWLAYHGERLEDLYPKPWQRIEAFRALLKATASKIKGNYPREKNTGILDIKALLKASLPKPNRLKKRRGAVVSDPPQSRSISGDSARR